MLGWDALRSSETLRLFRFEELEARQMRDQLLGAIPAELHALVGEEPVTVQTMRHELANRTAARFADLDDTVLELARAKEIDILNADGKPISRTLQRLRADDRIAMPRKPLLPGLSLRSQRGGLPGTVGGFTLSMEDDSEVFMSASTATATARPALDKNVSFESPRAWVDEDGSPNRRVLADVVQRIVQAVDPDRIVLFGSGARGTMKAGSDLDLLLVKAGCNSRELAARAQCGLSADGPPVDVIAATPEHAEKHRDSLSLVLGPALREGVIVYDRTAAVEIADAVRRGSAANKRARAADKAQKRLYKPEEALDWLRKARSELAHSRNPDPEVELDSRCINLQAAAERALKGIITAHGVAVEFTHKLVRLADQAPRAGETLPPLDRRKLRLLSNYRDEAQYPGWDGETTEQDFRDVRQIAVAIVQHAERRIPEILEQRRSMPGGAGKLTSP